MQQFLWSLFCLLIVSNSTLAQDSYQYQADEVTVPAAIATEPVIEYSLKKALQHLEDGAVAWSKQKKCVSCHTNGSYLFIRPSLTKSLGQPTQQIRDFFVEQLVTLKKTEARKLKRSGTRPAQVIYIAAGLAEWDAHVTKKLSPETDAALRLTFEIQNKDGVWNSLTCWPPFESSAYQEATMAAMAVVTAPGWLASLKPDDPALTGVELLKKYMRDTKPPHEYGRVIQLWASLRMDGILSKKQQAGVVELIRSKQQKDGGWSLRQFASPEQWGGGNRASKLRAEPNFASPASDGHMTGLACLVLQAAGVSNDDDHIKRGIQWLKSNQRKSGRWWTRSLNTDKWHFITYSGTIYPVLAIQNAELARRK
jgi:squalene-hopene/tetraprenyl-beta-curcumene cyclase